MVLLTPAPCPPAPADVDECQVHNGGCQHRCVNTPGSYFCECKPGFRLHADGRTCLGKHSPGPAFLTSAVTPPFWVCPGLGGPCPPALRGSRGLSAQCSRRYGGSVLPSVACQGALATHRGPLPEPLL